MPAEWNPETRELHLHNDQLSYVLAVLEDGTLGHLHFGGPLAPGRSYRHLAPGPFRGFDNGAGEHVRLECPTPGRGDFRPPALTIQHADGSTALHLAWVGHRLLPGKPPLPGLPSTYVEGPAEADSVELELLDAPSGVRVFLAYTVFRDLPVVTRHVRVVNGGAAPVVVRSAMSASLDLAAGPWDLLHLSGAWARERHPVRRRVVQGSQGVSSVRGASSHQHNPFLVLERPGASEEAGEVHGFGLVYSGNFLAEVEGDAQGGARVRIGIHPDTFSWRLEPGEDFHTPEAVLAYSARGRGPLSDALHRLYRTRLARGPWRDRPRPVLLNNWEGTYFDFDEDKLVRMAAAARELGVELFVLDDGWFGERNDDTSSLGDWWVNRSKLPGGLDGLARRIEALGMSFGLWIEPEMVSPRSRLFAEHPDWALGGPGRRRTEIRNQYVLDLARPEVVEFLFERIAGLLRGAPIRYLKWDMNRSITDPFGRGLPPDRQGELFHRYMLGVYALYERITRAFPEVLIESCAGGGGRFDPGLLAYAPQAWTSDDSDAVERLRIQWGTSLAYPLSAMGAHVSAVPNHQVGRVTPLSTRAAVAFFGVFGYELDPTALTPEERGEVADQIAFYQRHRALLQGGRFVRLVSPFEEDGNEAAWLCVSADGRAAVVGFYRVLQRASAGARRVRLRDLDPRATYRVTAWPAPRGEEVRGGDELMRAGLLVDPGGHAPAGDFWSRVFVLEAV